MKIMYFLDDGQSFGGAANTLLQQAILMKKCGHEVLAVISNYRFQKPKENYIIKCLNSNIEICYLPFQISSHTEDIDIVCLVENYHHILDAIKNYHPNILHTVQINAIVELVARELRIPHIMNIYPLIPEFFSVPYTNIFAHFHLCDSVFWAKKWEYYMHTDSMCVRTVVNCNIVRKDVKNKSEICYICVGSFYKEKNQLEVIRAFARGIRRGIRGKLVLYGYAENDYAKQCQDYITQNKMGEVIQLKGFVSDMQNEYTKADVLICGSIRESYPNVISEALANGLVIISTPVGGVPEIIEDGVNGYLSDGFSEESICNKIIQFDRERDTNKIILIQDNAYSTVYKYHSQTSVAQALSNYYQYVLNVFDDRIKAPGFKDIYVKFISIINIYRNNKKFFTNSETIQLKLWYIFHIKPIINELIIMGRKNVYIWGTGKMAVTVREIKECFFEGLELCGFIDTFKTGTYYNLEIHYPQNILLEKESIIFIGAMNGQNEIITQLKQYGKEFNKDYFILVPRLW